ncbi:MAG: DUF2341 domain-containing protein [Salinivirgaceae bacterium]|nr:DUF2341 domain-containing protein [Salinivirgaceae bacterium]
MKLKDLFIIICAFFASTSGYAQTGPGGVGTNDGTSSLELWLKAGIGLEKSTGNTAKNNDDIEFWLDQSGNGINATEATNKPYLDSTNLMNGYPVLHYVRTNGDRLLANGVTDGSENEATIYVVISPSNYVNNTGILQASPNGRPFTQTTSDKSIGIWLGATSAELWGRFCETDGTENSFAQNIELSGGVNYFVSNMANATDLQLNQYVNGTSTGSVLGYDGTIKDWRAFGIGRQGSESWDGEIAEVIAYSKALNAAEKVIVDNYLSSKFNIAMDAANDFYAFDTKHHYDIAGIGQSAGESTTQAKSDSILTIKTPSSLSNDEYIIFGHDNKSRASWLTTELPNGDTSFERLAREWRFDVTGDPGTVTISLDESVLPTKSTDFDFYLLWIDEDGDFSNGAIAYSLTENGGEYEATGVTITDGSFLCITSYKPEVNFTSLSSAAFESITPGTATISISHAVYSNILVDYDITGTATGTGTDYTLANGTATIISGNTSANISASINTADITEELDETIIMDLVAPLVNCVLGSNTTHTYTINDDDNAAGRNIAFHTPCDYSYKKLITIDNTKISGTSYHENFPVLISITADADLLAGVANANAYDIGFTLKDSHNWLDHQIQSYDAATGTLLAWVRFDKLSCTEDTEIEMYYGNATITQNPSSTKVWNTDLYHTVIHLDADPTGTAPQFIDQSGNGNNGRAANGLVANDLETGKIGGAINFDRRSDEYIAIDNLVFTPATFISETAISAWIKTTDNGKNTVYSYDRSEFWRMGINSLGGKGGIVDFDIATDAGNADIYTNEDLNDGNWHHLVATFNNGLYNIYFDGVFQQANSLGTVIGLGNLNRSGIIGGPSEDFSDDPRDADYPDNVNLPGNPGAMTARGMRGLIDETRHFKKAVSAQWIATEFANQNDPATFFSISAEQAAVCGYAESVDSLVITIEINTIDGSNPTTVNYAVVSGTAESGTDYVMASGTATIPSGENRTQITLDIINDLVDENDETITIELSTPSSNTNLGTNKSLTFTLLDDDDAPTVQYLNTTMYINEGADLLSIPIQLSEISGKDVIVEYTITGGTATGSGTDYLLTNGSVTIEAGELSANISANIVDDSDIESQETILLDLAIGTPITATLGANTTTTIIINDNDNAGYEGPGGVGSLDGTGNLVMWIVADSLITKDGSDAVSKWGNLVNIPELDLYAELNEPKWNDLAANGHAEISFGVSNDRLQTNTTLSAAYFPRNEATTFTVTRHDNSSQQSCSYSTVPLVGASRFSAHMPWNNTTYFDIGVCCETDARVLFTYDPTWIGDWQVFSYRAGTTEGKDVWKDNIIVQTDATNSTSTITNHASYDYAIGGYDGNKFQGDISEHILFKNPINNTQINIINNYLAAKYGSSLTNDMFAFQASNSHDVAGIGQESVSDYHIAAKANAVTINNASDLDNGEYMFFGHDNEDITTWSKTNVIPTDSVRRVAREWRFDITGTPGTISISIDTTYLPNKPSSYTEYIITIDDDGDFTSGATTYSTELVNGEYIASNVAINDGSYMAICTAIRTISFDAIGTNSDEASSKNIVVNLNIPNGEDLSVNYIIKSGTATGGNADYSLQDGNITILAGQTSVSIAPGIIDDAIIENEENLILALRNAPAGIQIGADSTHTYRIQDNDNTREVEFRSAHDYSAKRTITIDNTKIAGSTDLINFPVLISITGAEATELKATVQNANGYDIAFSLKDTVIWLSHEIEKYDPTTGEYVAWVKIPTLAYNSDTELEMYYGNANITVNPSTDDVWTEYYGVWHLHNDVNDASPNKENGFNSGSTDVVGAKIGDGQYFDGNSYIELPDFPNLITDFTITAWINPTDRTQAGRIVCDDANNDGGYFLDIGSEGAGDLRFASRGMNDVSLNQNANLNNGTWYYVAGVADITSQNRHIYLNGILGISDLTDGGTWGQDYGNLSIGGEVAYGESNKRIDGQLDEVRISKNPLSADWLLTEFNNQNNPATFYSIDIEEAITSSGAETMDTLLLTVYVNEIDYSSVTTVNYDASGGTATSGVDYSGFSGTATIAAGNQSLTFAIKITNDLNDELDETLEISLSDPIGANIGTKSSTTFTILDDDTAPTISFVDAASYINEGTNTIIIPLELNNASGYDVTVNYTATGGTATGSGTDYIISSNVCTIEKGDLTANITFSIIDDAEIEVPETIILEISGSTGATLGATTSHTTTINDNDDEGFDGPGGVGSADGTGSLVLWLRGDDGISTDGSNGITAWDNMIGISGLNMVPATTAKPIWREAELNGHSVVSFENVNDALVTVAPLSATYFPYNEATTLTITTHDNLTQQSDMYTTGTSPTAWPGTNRFTSHIPWNGTTYFDIGQCCGAEGRISFGYQSSWIGSASLFTYRAGTTYGKEVWKDNTSVKTVAGTSAFTNHPDYKFYLGRQETHPFQGDFAEFIMYTKAVNNAQINILNNYLAAKYNLTIANDLYNFDVSHGFEVAGIGREDASNMHIAAKAGFVTINNASTLTDGDYIMFGHNNASSASWIATDVPAGASIQRLTREWRYSVTGAPGTITISIDTTMLPAKTADYNDYIIMVDANGNFSADATVYNTTLVDGEYKASNIALTMGDYVAIGIIKRNISFNSISDNSFETSSNTIAIIMDYASSVDVELDYVIKSSTATGGNVDYSLANGSITILAGQTSVNIDPGIINDTYVESDENFVLALRNVPSGYALSADSVFTYTIHDDDNPRKIEFQSVSDSGDEDAGTITVTVEINSVDATNATTVNYAATGGTAEANPSPDYVLTAGTVEVLATESTATFTFDILDDVLDEADTETIIITLSNPTNANLGTDITYTYTINDNDNSPSIQLQTTASNIDEGAVNAAVVVELSNSSGQDVTIDYAVNASSTATGGGIDYVLTNGTLTINKGNLLGTINVALTDDALEESAETVIIDISVPTGATLGTNQQHTVTISDNDALVGYYGPGGVGDKEIVELWLDATKVNGSGVASPNDGDAISEWKDISGNNMHFTSIGSGLTAPEYDENNFNSKPSISISSSQLGLRAPVLFSNSLGNYSFFSAVEQASGQFLTDQYNSGNGNRFALNQNTSGLYYSNAWRLTGNSSTNENIMSWIFDAQANPESEVYRDGLYLNGDNNYNVMTLANNFSIGSKYTAEAVSDFVGNISEIIVFSKPLNNTQRIIVENYLAAKYQKTTNTELYSYDGSHGNDLIGIGQQGADDMHLTAMSDSILMVSSASSLGIGDYVFSGHDNGDISAWTVSEAPNSGKYVKRLAREWRTEVTGTPGTVILKIDHNNLPAPPANFDQYVIWIDNDGDFRYGATTYQLEYSAIDDFYVSDPITLASGDFIAIGCGKPVIEFSLSSDVGIESGTNPNIEVELNFTRGEDVTVDYFISGGDAIGGNVDYLLPSGTLTVSAGQSSAKIIPGIINDILLESSETFEVTIFNPSVNITLGTKVIYTFTINDDDNDRKIYLLNTSSTHDEGDGTISITVELNDVDNTNPTTAQYSVYETSTATEGDDFAVLSGTVTIPKDASTTTFDVSLTDDSMYENPEDIVIRLSNPTNANLGTNLEYVLSITDNDPAPEVQFSATTGFGEENMSPVQIELELNETSGSNVQVNYVATIASTASNGNDFILANGTLTIPAGQLSEDILLQIIDDNTLESTETVVVTISGPVNSILGGNTTFTYTINDNDQAGHIGPGGVGNSDNLFVWLRADKITDIATWEDQSGNDFDVSSAGASQPSLIAADANFNGKATVQFDGNDYFTADNITSGADDYTIFYAYKSSSTNLDQNLFEANNTTDFILRHNENNSGSYYDASNAWQGPQITGTNKQVLEFYLESGTNTASVFRNGTSLGTDNYTETAIGGTRKIGSNAAGSANFFTGEIGEIVFYNSMLNTSQEKIVQNYLAAKYDITISNDLYAHQATHNEDLAGIGQDDASNLHLKAQSAQMITISNPSTIGFGDYLLIAHDGASIDTWNTIDQPNIRTERISREWKVGITGTPGTISITLDTTLLPARPADYPGFVLLVDSDGDFTTGSVAFPMYSVSGSLFQVDDIVLADGNYFTIGATQNTTDMSTSGDFNLAANWASNIVPGSGETAIISIGHPMFLTANTTIGSLVLKDAASLDLGGYTLTLDDGCITFGSGSTIDVSQAGNTIEYVKNGDQCITGMEYYNLKLESSGNKYLTGNIIINNNFIIADNSVVFESTSNNYGVELKGNWTSSGVFNEQNSSVTFNGTSAQAINTTNAETFYNLMVNNTGNNITLASDVIISNSLDLSNGDIVLGTNDLTLEANAAIIGGGSNSYIQAQSVGVVKSNIGATPSAKTFPVGDASTYSPFAFTLNTGTLSSSYVTLNLRASKHGSVTFDNYISRYWILHQSGISGTINYDVNYNYAESDITGDETALKARKFSISGDALGGTNNSTTNTLSYIGHTSFSDLTGEGPDVPLPIELIYFTANSLIDDVELLWGTLTELNNDYFEIERSTDATNFTKIGQVNGFGTSINQIDYMFTDKTPISGIAYYRLKQVDYNGAYEYHKIIKVDWDDNYLTEESINVYPNPYNNGELLLDLLKLEPYTSINIHITDHYGKTIFNASLLVPENKKVNLIPLAIDNLPQGIYFVTVSTTKNRFIKKVIVQ